MIHGISGYFTAELYQEIYYSTNPATHTPNMHSWFPIFFPITNPIIARKGEEITIQIWREHSKSDLWYEWAISVH